MKKFLFTTFFLLLILGELNTVFAANKIEIIFFYKEACPFCVKGEVFLNELEKKYPEIAIKRLPVLERENIQLLKQLYEKYDVPQHFWGRVPITFIQDKYFLGFDKEIGKNIESYILSLQTKVPSSIPSQKKRIKIPLIGEIDLAKFSLPILAGILGFFDGFNVCSLGALVLILGIVLAIKKRIQILILGGVFLLTTGIIYGILIIFWHRLFLILSPYLRRMEIVIGLLAVLGGIYFLREFLKFRKRGPVCEFAGISQKLSAKIQKVFEKRAGILTLAGAVFLFALIITIIEFPCSAVLPVIFAGILSEAKISTFPFLFYLLIYLLFYLLDEAVVFLVSVFTLKLWVASPKFVTFLNPVASIILFLLGAHYLFGLV
ncbi:MAG: hypothetical protein LR000_02490 [Candidatus Pacebacteria bacterium]|nr:hypothetical protein [Candidatus Paceibacterota bacterium]